MPKWTCPKCIRKTGKHSGKRFVKNLRRFCLLDLIMQCKNFDELKIKVKTKEYLKFYCEFKLLNIIWLIEHELLTFLDYLYLSRKITNIGVIKNKYINLRAKYYKNISKTEKKRKAKIAINRKVNKNYRLLFTPHVAFHMCGLGLNDLVDILKQNTSSFLIKQQILKKLLKLNDCRIIFLHDYFTSRIDASKKILEGVIVSGEIKTLIDDELNKNYYKKLLK